jgi:glycosyltransferase involved in cell wall biosynthesis
MTHKTVSIIIPVINEAESIGQVLESIPRQLVDEILVIDGGSSDATVFIAEEAGARVIHESRPGYSRACHTGLLAACGDIVVFLDGDGADDPAHLPELLQPILDSRADLVLGSRLAGPRDPGAMHWTKWFGNFFAAWLFRLLYRLPITDLSPFRAGLRSKILELDLQDMTYGLPTEMIALAARRGWKIVEIPVSYHVRYGGKSKITGTWRGSFLASTLILRLIFRCARSQQ